MKILFQGDSVTDCGRDRGQKSGIESLGPGYPKKAAQKLTELFPDMSFEFMNRGISGDRLSQVYARLEPDIVIEYPDVTTFLLGVNDCGFYNLWKLKLDIDRFKQLYINMIKEIRSFHPTARFMILEPFFYPAGSRRENLEHIAEAIVPVQKACREVAQMFDIPFVPLQEKFNERCTKEAPEGWLQDGIHPTIEGHEMIAEEWVKAFVKNYINN